MEDLGGSEVESSHVRLTAKDTVSPLSSENIQDPKI